MQKQNNLKNKAFDDIHEYTCRVELEARGPIAAQEVILYGLGELKKHLLKSNFLIF